MNMKIIDSVTGTTDTGLECMMKLKGTGRERWRTGGFWRRSKSLTRRTRCTNWTCSPRPRWNACASEQTKIQRARGSTIPLRVAEVGTKVLFDSVVFLARFQNRKLNDYPSCLHFWTDVELHRETVTVNFFPRKGSLLSGTRMALQSTIPVYPTGLLHQTNRSAAERDCSLTSTARDDAESRECASGAKPAPRGTGPLHGRAATTHEGRGIY